MGRIIKVGPNSGKIRCDFCHKPIEYGKTATQIKEGDAQGIYHGRRCYEAAIKHYEQLKVQEGLNETEDEWDGSLSD